MQVREFEKKMNATELSISRLLHPDMHINTKNLNKILWPLSVN